MGYGVRSAGSWMDKDSEMFLYPDCPDVYHPPKRGDDPPPPPEPRMAYVEIDFAKDKVDLMAVERFLSGNSVSEVDSSLSPRTARRISRSSGAPTRPRRVRLW